MSDSRWLRRMIRFGLLGVAAMTVLVPIILLARGTTGHNWYSAGKLTLAEAMLAAGFSEYTTVAYRREYGDTWNIMRAVFVDFGPPVRARQHILTTIGDGVMLGAGVGGTVFCLMLLGAAGHLRRGRAVATVEPTAYPYRHPAVWSQAGRFAGSLPLHGPQRRFGRHGGRGWDTDRTARKHRHRHKRVGPNPLVHHLADSGVIADTTEPGRVFVEMCDEDRAAADDIGVTKQIADHFAVPVDSRLVLGDALVGNTAAPTGSGSWTAAFPPRRRWP